MKKFLLIILTLSMLLSIVACNDGGNENDGKTELGQHDNVPQVFHVSIPPPNILKDSISYYVRFSKNEKDKFL